MPDLVLRQADTAMTATGKTTFVAARLWFYAPGVASHLSQASGGVLLTGTPQLGPDGSVANAGFTAAVGELAALAAAAAATRANGTVASTAGNLGSAVNSARTDATP